MLTTNEILEAAKIGLLHQRHAIDEQIQRIDLELHGVPERKQVRKSYRTVRTRSLHEAKPQRRKMSRAGRASIAAAQKARWAAYHKSQGKAKRAA